MCSSHFFAFEHFDAEILEQITEGIPNATAVQLDISDTGSLHRYISEVMTFLQYGLNSSF